MAISKAAIAINRFGLGLPAKVPGDAAQWLVAQLDRYDAHPAAITAGLRTPTAAGSLARDDEELRRMRAAIPADGDGSGPRRRAAPSEEMRAFQTERTRISTRRYVDAAMTRFDIALASSSPFVERLVHFWANHFAVSADKPPVRGMAGAFEFDAIRPHVLGRFEDLLIAAERHPAMLLYLDQAHSLGTGSPAARRARARRNVEAGINENLAREILELHTMGVGSGYGQSDVIALAQAMAGWTVPGLAKGPMAAAARGAAEPGETVFVADGHEPGARKLLGRSYPAAGAEQSTAMLRDLARHPATARHVATRLARAFAGETAPDALIARLERSFVDSRGDLPTLYRTLVASPEMWVDAPLRFRTPWEWTIACCAMLGGDRLPSRAAEKLLRQLGQPVWEPGSPAGFDDRDASWAAPEALMRRVSAAERMAARSTSGIDPAGLARAVLPGSLTPVTAAQIARVDSPQQALALLMVSPDLLRV